MPLGKRFAEELSQALRHRRIKQGIAMLDAAEGELMSIGPDAPHSARVLLLLAQWIDLGYRDYRFLDALLLRFPPESRKRLSVEDYLHLRMVEAFRGLATGDSDPAIEALDFVLKSQADLGDEQYAALAHFWKGRAHRKKGEYGKSLEHIIRAREMAQNQSDKVFTAVIQVQESWLLFQKGMTREALQILSNAEPVLKATDHYVALGNIESARGRIVRRLGEYTRALEHFTRALELYARRDANHLNLARTLVNAAYVRRLLALQMRKRIDRQAQSGRSHPGKAKAASLSGESLRARYQELSQEAMRNLTRAREIYDLHRHADGIGKVTLNLGYLHLDRGDIDRATPEAEEAYRIGQEQGDHILMARARILQAAIENAHVEEQTGEDVDVAVHANRAREYSEEALKLAHGTQNLRLLAGACIARGMTAANEFFQDWEEARRRASEATGLIGPGENDHLVEDLSLLKSRIVQASGINDTLRGWSEGMLGNKTFQQISEEFAEIVIPKVWMREDRKISRVAERLSISPKKVRRILRNAGSVDHG
ncbi:MAG TPA: tetratricopeptide repeat protein [Terracidiphilus sp.]|jgi:tetratricopeptide (TPR) repeat protein|nr:tetratricopeptide repeat protein [Terracidiphilus sp.]